MELETEIEKMSKVDYWFFKGWFFHKGVMKRMFFFMFSMSCLYLIIRDILNIQLFEFIIFVAIFFVIKGDSWIVQETSKTRQIGKIKNQKIIVNLN